MSTVFLGKQLSSYQSNHSGSHKRVLEYYGFTKENGNIWLLSLLQERITSGIHTIEIIPDNQGFRVTHILPLRLDEKQQKKHKIDLLPYSLTTEFALKKDGTFDKEGGLISRYILHTEVEGNILKTLRNSWPINNEKNSFLFFGGDRLTAIKMVEKIPLNRPVFISNSKIKSNKLSKLDTSFGPLVEELTTDYSLYWEYNVFTLF